MSEQKKIVEELGARIREVLAASPAQDLERNLQGDAGLQVSPAWIS